MCDDVFDDVAGCVVDAAGFADFRFFFDDDAAAMGAYDFAEEAFVNGAEDFDGDVGEEIGRFVSAEFADEVGEELVGDNQIFAEVFFEEVAVEKWDMGGRAAVEMAEMANDAAPEEVFRSFGSREVRGRWLVEFERALAAGAVVAAGVAAPGLEHRIEAKACVDVAVFTNAKEEDAIEDALSGFVQLVAVEEIFAVVGAEEIGSEFAAGFVEEV